MSAHDEWATVPVDGKGTLPAATMAAALLALTDNPREVVWVPGANEFRVPDDLAERYRKSLHTPKTKRRPAPSKEASNG